MSQAKHMKRWHNGQVNTWEALNGERASLIIFADGSRAYGGTKGQGGPLICSVEKIAGELFVSMVEHDEDGNEVARHNAEHIESIVWATNDTGEQNGKLYR